MNSTAGQKPLIMIDLVKPRIRINKKALQVIGNPEYIFLLINPTERMIAIKAASRKDPMAHPVPWHVVVRKSSFEIYSLPLLKKLGQHRTKHGEAEYVKIDE